MAMAANAVATNFILPTTGFTLVARVGTRVRGTGGRGTGTGGTVRSLSRLDINSCVIRGIRNVNVFRNVRTLRLGGIGGSCVGVSCTGNSILCIPIARLSLISGCVNPNRDGGIGVGHLNNGR